MKKDDKTQFVTTKFGNKISKKSVLCGSDKICVRGKTIIEAKAVIRGDLAGVNIGQCCIIGQGAVIRPADQRFRGSVVFIPVNIGDNTIIEADTTVEAAAIGSFVRIGKNCRIGKRAILSDCVQVRDDTVVPPGMVVPPFSILAGAPATIVGKLPEAYQLLATEETVEFFKHFVPAKA